MSFGTRCSKSENKAVKKPPATFRGRLFCFAGEANHKTEKPPRIRKDGFSWFAFDYNSSHFRCNRNSAEHFKDGFSWFTSSRAMEHRR
jgi:hypothetical protein